MKHTYFLEKWTVVLMHIKPEHSYKWRREPARNTEVIVVKVVVRVEWSRFLVYVLGMMF